VNACELARFSSGEELCEDFAEHVVTVSHPDDPPAASPDEYELCRAHAAGAMEGKHRHPPIAGEAVTVTPGLGGGR